MPLLRAGFCHGSFAVALARESFALTDGTIALMREAVALMREAVAPKDLVFARIGGVAARSF